MGDRPEKGRGTVTIPWRDPEILLKLKRLAGRRLTLAGLDPAPKGTTGWAWALFDGHDVVECGLGESGLQQALLEILNRNPLAVGIDAPLHPPYRGFRAAEREVIRRLGARLLPGGFPGMRELSAKGLSIAWCLWEAGIAPVETHPGTVRRLLGLSLGGHVWDALLSLYTTACAVFGEASVFHASDGLLLFPRDSSGCRRLIHVLEGCAPESLPDKFEG
ncbi:MAG: hypothetical protein F7C35_00960 [Desulfurococcales archaeon]|nr:hypothetical protein [Desulfurococcales archaeon]